MGNLVCEKIYSQGSPAGGRGGVIGGGRAVCRAEGEGLLPGETRAPPLPSPSGLRGIAVGSPSALRPIDL